MFALNLGSICLMLIFKPIQTFPQLELKTENQLSKLAKMFEEIDISRSVRGEEFTQKLKDSLQQNKIDEPQKPFKNDDPPIPTLQPQSNIPVTLNEPLKDEILVVQPKIVSSLVYRPVYPAHNPRVHYPVHQYPVVRRPQPYEAVQRRGLPDFRSDIDKRLDASSNMLRRTSEMVQPTFGFIPNQFLNSYQENPAQSQLRDSNEEFEKEIKIIQKLLQRTEPQFGSTYNVYSKNNQKLQK